MLGGEFGKGEILTNWLGMGFRTDSEVGYGN